MAVDPASVSYQDAIRYCEVRHKDVARMLREEIPPLREGTGRPKKNCVVNTVSQRGSTNATYLTRRLKRDHPDIAERLAVGEFRSVRAAAIEGQINLPLWKLFSLGGQRRVGVPGHPGPKPRSDQESPPVRWT